MKTDPTRTAGRGVLPRVLATVTGPVSPSLVRTPPEGVMNGLALRLRNGIVEQHGVPADKLVDLRVNFDQPLTFQQYPCQP